MRPSRTGGTVPHIASSPPGSPVLSLDSSPHYLIAWSGATPDNWGIYDPADVTPGSELDSFPGSTTSSDASNQAGETVVARGVDSAFTTFQTPVSNPVTVPG